MEILSFINHSMIIFPSSSYFTDVVLHSHEKAYSSQRLNLLVYCFTLKNINNSMKSKYLTRTRILNEVWKNNTTDFTIHYALVDLYVLVI